MSAWKGGIADRDAQLGRRPGALEKAAEKIPDQRSSPDPEKCHGEFTPKSFMQEIQDKNYGHDFDHFPACKKPKGQLLDNAGRLPDRFIVEFSIQWHIPLKQRTLCLDVIR